VASPIYHKPPDPPGIYRAARALRRLSVVVLVLIVVFVAVVAYSAIQIVHAQPHLTPSTSTVEPNDTVDVASALSLTNPTYFAIQHFSLHFLIVNDSNVPILDSYSSPVSIAAGGTAYVPVNLYVPVSTEEASLLTQDQYLEWNIWGNASYAYLFTVSIGEQTERAWGAPFDDLKVATGAPTVVNGGTEVPVTVSFVNDASFALAGTLSFQVVPPSGTDCSQGSFGLNVPSQNAYNETQDVGVAAGCDPAGGFVDSQYVGNGLNVSLPPEPIP
jgi:hypothetical protein